MISALPFIVTAALAIPVSTAHSDTVPLYDVLGSYSRPITTTSAEAQDYFDQGMRLTFGFGHSEAQRSFRHAALLDPECAMCQWGLAWSLGPYINAQMDSAGGVQAYAAASRAVELSRSAEPIERALIDAMAARYAAVPTEANRPGLDSAYVDAMRDVVRRFPDDLDAAALLGEALMVLRPWDQWTRRGDPQPGTPEVLTVLESVLERDMRHPGACHHYIHATEASRDPGRAAACGDHLGSIIPGASHIPHMPSHTYMRVGRYGDAVRANQLAWVADQRAAFGGPPGIYPSHNLHMLVTAGIMDGQSSVAIQAARDLARDFTGSGFYEVLTLARFGRWREVLETETPGYVPLNRAVNHMSRGLAHLALGNADSARIEMEALAYLRETTLPNLRFRGHPQISLISIADAILTAEIAAAAGRHTIAIDALREVLPLEDALDYDEPEPWPFPVRHLLGAILLEAGRPAEAEAAFREDLEVHPNNAWALSGLAESLRAQGRLEAATAARAQAEQAWSRADVVLHGPRVIPRPPTAAAADTGAH